MTTVIKIESDDHSLKAETATEESSVAVSRPPVIFVVTQSDNRANGGVESITQVLERLRAVRPLVITQSETRFNQRWQDAGLKVSVWPRPSRGAVSMLKANVRMFKLVRSEACRVVHCNDIEALWHSAFGARAAGAAVVFNVRNIKPADQRYGWRWQLARRLSSRQLVLSKEMSEAFRRRLGVDSKSSHVEQIYSAVDTHSFSPADSTERAALRARLQVDPDSFAVGFVAAFDPRKQQLEFIKEAGPLLKQLLPRAKVYFIGDFAPERNHYARLCAEAVRDLGLQESISFVGYTATVAEWYRALDLVVVASRNEGLARCMIEGLSCGTPVVSFDVCSAREILEQHDCGLVVENGDYPQLVQKLVDLAAAPDMRGRFAENGAALARSLFDPPTIAAKYEQLYFSLNGN